MLRSRRIRFVEPHGRPGRPFNAWIAQWPLLGPITLATILDAKGFDAAVYNENISGPVTDNPDAWTDLCEADVVGISIMTPTASRGYELAGRIRAASDATIVFGGVHATFRPEEAIAHGDVVVRGEGEAIIERVARGETPAGIVDSEPLDDIDEIPAMNYRLMFDFDKLVGPTNRRARYKLPVMTSRGCPYGCTYCSVTRMFGRKVRRQSVDKVYRDVVQYMSQGFRQMFFYDDNFTAHKRWTRELLQRLEPLGIGFNAQVRADFPWIDRARTKVDTPLLQSMKRAGGDVLYIGYETVEDETAAGWNKGYRGDGSLRQRLMHDTHILHDHGFWIHGMFVLGPQHTEASADGIVRFARDSGLETMQISILTPLPGTPLFEEMKPHLLFNDYPRDWDFYDGTHCVYDHSRLGLERLQQAVLDAHLKFYRWGGWSTRRIRAFVEQNIPLGEKLQMLWANAKTARTTLRAWRRETGEFLDIARRRLTASTHQF